MFFEVVCLNSNPNIGLLKKLRFYREIQHSDRVHYRKTVNQQDDFLQPCFITPEGVITHQNNPRVFNLYAKQALHNKCPFKSAEWLSNEIRNVLLHLAENRQPVSFAYAEMFEHLPEVSILAGNMRQQDFYIDFGKRYVITSHSKQAQVGLKTQQV